MKLQPYLLWGIYLATSLGLAQTPPPLTKQAPNRPNDARTLRDLAYVEGGTRAQRLDLFLPVNATKPVPLIIWVHGGGWAAGDKGNSPATRLIADGYAVASLNYRLSGEAPFPAQIQDCKAAVRWLRANAEKYGIDAAKFGAWGSSAGGHLVALLGTAGDRQHFTQVGGHPNISESVQAVCDFFGPTDLLLMDQQSAGRGVFRHDDARSPEGLLIGGAIQENKEKTARANPLQYLSKDAPPFLILHGIQDHTVPLGQSELLAERLKANRTPVTFQKIIGGHGGPAFSQPNADALVRSFFAQTLKGQEQALKTFTIEDNTPDPSRQIRR